jgi:membrane protease YdiL (CAAX protease family)
MVGGTSESGGTTPRRWGVWATLAWSVAAFPGAVIVVGLAVRAIITVADSPALTRLIDSSDGRIILIGIPGGCAAAGTVLLAAYLSRNPVAAYLGLVPCRAHLAQVVVIAIATLAFPTLMFRVLAPAFGVAFGPDGGVGATGWVAVLLWISTAIVTPVYEELLFRGLLYRGLAASRLGVVGAVGVTAVLFAVVHGHRLEWFDMLYLTAMGLGYGVLRARSDSVLPSILVHGLINGLPKTVVTGEWLLQSGL